jgi:hypothetical protein
MTTMSLSFMPDTREPLYITDDSLSRAWARTFLHVLDHPGTAIAPLLVSVTGFTADGLPQEDPGVRTAMDACLAASGKLPVEKVAWTIFPQSLWRLARGDRRRLHDLYRRALPRFQALRPALNRRGLYFERLIAYGRGPEDGNQLEWIITAYRARSGVRQTMFQASVFDPARDHVRDARLVFPCLQHVSLVPDGNELTMNAFYATQQLFDKAYGNWLGLCHLGGFLAQEMGLAFARLNCYCGVEKLEGVGKRSPQLVPLVAAARRCVGGAALLAAGGGR